MRMLLGMSYAAIGELDSAIRVISDYLNNPKNEMHRRVDDFYVLGVLYFRNQEYSKAADALTKQIEINPAFADAYYYLGSVREAQSNQSAADQAFTQAEKRFNGEFGGYTRTILGIHSSKKE